MNKKPKTRKLKINLLGIVDAYWLLVTSLIISWVMHLNGIQQIYISSYYCIGMVLGVCKMLRYVDTKKQPTPKYKSIELPTAPKPEGVKK